MVFFFVFIKLIHIGDDVLIAQTKYGLSCLFHSKKYKQLILKTIF